MMDSYDLHDFVHASEDDSDPEACSTCGHPENHPCHDVITADIVDDDDPTPAGQPLEVVAIHDDGTTTLQIPDGSTIVVPSEYASIVRWIELVDRGGLVAEGGFVAPAMPAVGVRRGALDWSVPAGTGSPATTSTVDMLRTAATELDRFPDRHRSMLADLLRERADVIAVRGESMPATLEVRRHRSVVIADDALAAAGRGLNRLVLRLRSRHERRYGIGSFSPREHDPVFDDDPDDRNDW